MLFVDVIAPCAKVKATGAGTQNMPYLFGGIGHFISPPSR